MSRSASRILPNGLEPAWDVAQLFPPQGSWSEAAYLALPGNRLVELDEGRIEVLEMPSELHQLLVAHLYQALHAFVRDAGLGTVLFAPFPIKLWDGKIREPDVVFMRREHAFRRHDRYWQGADLVMEVMSPDDPKRDSGIKRAEYARAGIAEYWLIDPTRETVTVFVPDDETGDYRVHGIYASGQQATSVGLSGFRIDIGALFTRGARR